MLQNKIFYSVLTLMLSVMLAINPVRAGSNALNKALGIAGGIIGGRQILKELKRHGPSEGGPSQSRGERNRGGNSQDDDDDNSDERIEIQKSLAALGYDVGEPDGVFGEKTRAAIRAYQKDSGDEVSGQLTKTQRSALLKSPDNGGSPVKKDLAAPPPKSLVRCEPESAWQRVRTSHPLHYQTLASCQNPQTRDYVIVLTEPPPHLIRANSAAIIQALFSVPVKVETRRHALGYNGWVDDLIITAQPGETGPLDAVGDDLALLSLYAFGSVYKAEVEDISSMSRPPLWAAPPALEVTTEELHTWLSGPDAEPIVRVDGGPPAKLQELVRRGETGAFQSVQPGLVVAIVAAGASSNLNDEVDTLRRFALDSDVFLGAIRFSRSSTVLQDRVALIGRERTTTYESMPPLRVESILLLASADQPRLAQSYERNRPFAGKLLTGAGDLFGWDWAPILLSNELIDTEYGSLLNFTDNMLKSWSMSGKVQYTGFPHEYPDHYPFGTAGVTKKLNVNNLTFNWNTAGVGFVSRKGDIDLYSIRNTGSLPVSYIPEGSEDGSSAKPRLQKAEDDAYKYFSSLRNPLLERAVQYAALFQIFRAFEVHAVAPQDPAVEKARMSAVEKVLEKHIITAIDALGNPSSPSTADPQLIYAYAEHGVDGRRQAEDDEDAEKTQNVRTQLAALVAALDLRFGKRWREVYAHSPTTYEEDAEKQEVLEAMQGRFTEVLQGTGMMGIGLSIVKPVEQVRQEIVETTKHEPQGWIKTPSIVVSREESNKGEVVVGGHNIGGLPTRVELDPLIPRRQPRVTGSYREGRVIHVNPDDVPAGSGQELARILDREVGLHDNPASILRGTSALRSRIENASILARPVRPKIVALDFAGTEGRVLRGAQSSPGAKPVGYRPGSFNGEARDLEALAGNPDTHLVVQRRDNGFAIYRAQPRPPETLMVPNKPSLIMALKNYEHTVKAGPPPVKTLNILTDGLGPTELDLMTQTLANRMGGAGGKPPFGGKPTMAFADGPEPGRNSWRISMAKSESKPLPHENPGGARTHTIAVEGRGSDAVLSGKPQWHLAEFSFPEPGSYKLTPPEFQGSGIHIGEISVPLDIPKSGVKATLFRAFAKFRETLDAGRLKGMNAAVTKLFKGITEGDLYAALERYKTMMLEEFKAERIKVEFSREGMNFIVTEEPAIREGAWRG